MAVVSSSIWTEVIYRFQFGKKKLAATNWYVENNATMKIITIFDWRREEKKQRTCVRVVNVLEYIYLTDIEINLFCTYITYFTKELVVLKFTIRRNKLRRGEKIILKIINFKFKT